MKLKINITKGEKYFIARIPELGVTTQGRTVEEAKKNLREAAQLHLESIIDYLIKKGNVSIKGNRILPA